ncbi:prepilin-type N-terminal cleavage/methylation domain-containing protein [Uliginosibacterium gangwonense]|uniref:prepilin-type N-terminal cleavage/methylation domain-containing protein n=1 Tax=Uliginosibacterium gangwonense TaxID=392736 RepID=UPI000369225B|nr:prepilin-type N-terminal cleavage/methylation domain-containing protein [Uliginosibacterium gangwonense]
MKNYRLARHQQSGFTLVEIAIVLVIIGLLLGGVLKGQELINSAKSKAVISDFRNTATMIAAYQDRFRALPGDDANAAKHLSGAVNATGTPGDGLIGGVWNSSTATDESVLLWQHLRLAGLAAGDTTDPASAASLTDWLPRNTEGGRIGVQSTVPVAGWPGRLFVCQSNISGRIAQQVDTTMDDGSSDKGSVRFGISNSDGTITPVASSSAPAESTLYTICASF